MKDSLSLGSGGEYVKFGVPVRPKNSYQGFLPDSSHAGHDSRLSFSHSFFLIFGRTTQLGGV